MEKPTIYQIDETSRCVQPFLDYDVECYEIRFENADIFQIVDALNKLSDKFTVVASIKTSSSNTLAPSDNQDALPASEKDTLSGFFSGTYYEIIRDVCITGGYVFDRIDNYFYVASNPVDLAMCQTSSVLETSLQKDELETLKTTFQDDLSFSLVSNKLLIIGRFYAVKKFREYVLQLNEEKRSYVARLVFVRLERQSISRLEAELKASQLDLISSGYDLLSMFEAQLDVKLMRDNSYNYTEQLLYCTDGQKSALKIGSTFQREQRSVSDYGTSTTTGYQQFEDGVDIELTPYRSINGVVELQLKFGNSKFSDAANLAKNQVDLNYERLSVQENKLYYVASLTDKNASISARFLGLSNNNDGKVLTCWLVISPVKSDVDKTINDDF